MMLGRRSLLRTRRSDALQTALSQATYAWYGKDLPASGVIGEWIDRVQGVSASLPAAPSMGTLNNRKAVMFNGAQSFQTAAFAAGAIAQPYAIVAVVFPATTAANQNFLDGIDGTNRCFFSIASSVRYQFGTNNYVYSENNSAVAAASVFLAVANGNESSISRNGTLLASGTGGNVSVTGITIGATYGYANRLTGSIALVAIISGEDYQNRAAAIAAYAQGFYLNGTGTSEELLAMLQTSTYAWCAETLPATGKIGQWTDVKAGVAAIASTALPTVGTLNGRRAASFNNQYLQATFASSIAHPFAIVAVHDYGTPGLNLFVHDGIGVDNRAAVYYQSATNYLVLRRSVAVVSSFATTSPVVTSAIFNGASSQLYANGALIASGDTGQTSVLTGLTIGATYLLGNYFNGSIASLIVVSGTNYAARAEAIATAARALYGI